MTSEQTLPTPCWAKREGNTIFSRRFGHFLLAAILYGIVPHTVAAQMYQPGDVAVTVLNPTLEGTYRALLRRPPGNAKAHIGIFVMHTWGGMADNPVCMGLARRGYTTLCADTEFMGRKGTYQGYEDHVPAIVAGILHLRAQVPGITQVVLYGRSMGAPMMAFYENVQENGIAVCRSLQRILPCNTENLINEAGESTLPPVDGIILADAHLGDALATFTYMDPAVTNPEMPHLRDPALDMFAPANGYPGDAEARTPLFRDASYDAAFVERFLAAQAGRNRKVLEHAQDLWARIEAGDDAGLYPDDMLLTVPGSENAARLWQADLDLLKCTKRAHTFLTRDGRNDTSPGPICSVRVPSARFANADSIGSVLHMPIRVWLGAHALRTDGPYRQTENDLSGIDHESSNTSTVANVRGITKPLLLVANSAHYFIVTNEIIFDNAASADKTFAITEGAVHAGTPCTACEQALGLPHGSFGDTVGRAFDFIDAWLAERF